MGQGIGRIEKKDGDLQLFFPEVPGERLGLSNGDNASASPNPNDTQLYCTTKSVRSVSCILNLEKNGRFSMILLNDSSKNEKKTLDTHDCNSSNHPRYQPLQGEWYLGHQRPH